MAAAIEMLGTAKSVEQLRQAQAVVLPLRYGMSLSQTAEASVQALEDQLETSLRALELVHPSIQSIVRWPWIIKALLN